MRVPLEFCNGGRAQNWNDPYQNQTIKNCDDMSIGFDTVTALTTDGQYWQNNSTLHALHADARYEWNLSIKQQHCHLIAYLLINIIQLVYK